MTNITIIGHDWGAALGLHYARRNEGNVRGIVMMEPVIGSYTRETLPDFIRDLFYRLREPEGWDMLVNDNMFIEQLLPGGIVRKLSDEEMDHYRRPFTNPDNRRFIWWWPQELPIDGEPEDVVEYARAYREWLRYSDVPKLLFYADPGVLVAPEDAKRYSHEWKNCSTVDLGEGRHYLQEDHPAEIGEALKKWIESI